MATACRQVVSEVLSEAAEKDSKIVVLCSDSRGSGSMTPYFEKHPSQAVEVGIAEQDLVSISAGLASGGMRPFAVSPASFLCSRSVEQIKVDVCYSYTNVKLVAISGGVSYGALGMSHHACQDIAMVGAIPNIRVYIPSDRFQTKFLFEKLVCDNKPAYVRIGRNPVEDVYEEGTRFEFDKAVKVRDGNDVTIISMGEMVSRAKAAGELLAARGIKARVLDMYCIKPLDREAVIAAARETGGIVTVEEHSVIGGLGSLVASVTAESAPCRMKIMGLPDEELICGTQTEIFTHEGLTPEGIASEAAKLIGRTEVQ